MWRIKLIFLGALILSVVFCSSSLAFDNGDFQIWNTDSVSFRLNENWKIKFEEEFKFGDDAGDFYYQHSDLGIVYSGFAEWFDLSFNYRQTFEKKSGEWKEENRPHLNAVVKWKVSDISVAARSRLEYRNREDEDNFWRYRNKFTVKLPVEFAKFQIHPFVADEIFYDFDKGTLNKNRIYIGFSFKPRKGLAAEVYYLNESSEKGEEWTDNNVLGTKIKISF